MTAEQQTNETLSVEVERNGKKTATAKCNVPSSSSTSRQLYVQVKRRKFKRQYRRNQDAINFLRRFTLAVVIIDLILSISESGLISTFFLFLTLSTTFEVKPENVVDTYCFHYQGGGNAMCEQYMEHVTGYTPAPSSSNGAMNQHHRTSSSSSNNSPSENHFPTVPTRAPLSPSESRKLFLAYNQSLFESPIRFNFAQKPDKDSKLSRVYARLVYLLFESHSGILNDTRSLSEFVKNEANKLEQNPALDSFDSLTKSQKYFLQNLISQQVLKQTVDVISGTAVPAAGPLSSANNYLVFRLCAKTLDRLKASQKTKQRRLREENKQQQQQQQAINSANQNQAVNPFRKNLIQPTDFIRHRWKRNAFIPSIPSMDPSEEEMTTEGKSENDYLQITTGEHDEAGVEVEDDDEETTEVPGATGSIRPVEGESGELATTDSTSAASHQKEKQESGGLLSALSRTKASSSSRGGGGNGYRLIKRGNGNKKLKTSGDTIEEQGQILADDNFYDAGKAPVSRRGLSNSHNNENGMINQSAEYGKRDVPMIFTTAEGNLNDLLTNKKPTLQKSNNGNGGNQFHFQNRKFPHSQEKHLDELFLSLEKNPRHIMTLMEVALFNNWQQFTQAAKHLSIFYQIDRSADQDVPRNGKGDSKDESVIWLSVRQKIIENLVLNMETNVFSGELFKKAERRKRAMEQIYHDYSSSILGELKNVKEIPISRSFHTIYWVIKLYTLVWQLTICMVLFFGSIFEDKTALNIWGIFSILTSLLHFMVDDWINTSFQPEKTSASIWFGVVYGVYKPITILLVATLSSEIYKRNGGKKRSVLQRLCEVIRGRKRPPLILADKCLDKLKGLFITPEVGAEAEGGASVVAEGAGGKKDGITTVSSENNNGNIVYKGIKAVKIRAKIRRMEISNGNLVVVTQSGIPPSKEICCKACCICENSSGREIICSGHTESGNDDDEKVHELHLFQPSAPLDNDGGLAAEDLYPEDTDDEEEDDDELEEVVDEDDDESDEEKGETYIEQQCTHPDHARNLRQNQRPCTNPACTNEERPVPGTTMDIAPADMVVLSETSKPGGGSSGTSKSGQSALSLIAYAGNATQGNSLLDSKTPAAGNNGQSQVDDLLHGPIVDGGNLHI